MRVGLITTLNTNIGDDFIREGICIVLRKVFQGKKIEFICINKHRPMTVYQAWHPCHWIEYLPCGRRTAYPVVGKLFYKFGHSLFDDCDLIVQCGAPVFWPECYKCEWAEALWRQVVGRLYERIPVLNLAAGSSYAYEQQPSFISDIHDIKYVKDILRFCRLTTVRDKLARKLCASLGVKVPHICCSALLAAKDYNISNESGKIILINYMSGGGNLDCNQNIDSVLWQNTVQILIKRLCKRYTLKFLCHNKTEYDLAGQIDATIPRIWPKTPQEYFSSIANAQVALCNRMHASVGLASLGIASITVGTDTRLLMVDSLGIPNYYIKEVEVSQLEDQLEYLISIRSQERERLLTLQSDTMSKYVNVVTETLEGIF
ncbi:Polysaccharide pyruvyl transferase domain-containing protein [Candidatus Magnetomoraceae bacterium gMMP-13]